MKTVILIELIDTTLFGNIWPVSNCISGAIQFFEQNKQKKTPTSDLAVINIQIAKPNQDMH